MSRTWHISHVVVLVSVVLFALAFCAAKRWIGLDDPLSWMTAGLTVFAASFLPWRVTP